MYVKSVNQSMYVCTSLYYIRGAIYICSTVMHQMHQMFFIQTLDIQYNMYCIMYFLYTMNIMYHEYYVLLPLFTIYIHITICTNKYFACTLQYVLQYVCTISPLQYVYVFI